MIRKRTLPSIERWILTGLLSATTVIMGFMISWAYWNLQRNINQVFDSQLIDGVKTLQALLGDTIRTKDWAQVQRSLDTLESDPPTGIPISDKRYRMRQENRTILQVWDPHSHCLLLHSSFSPLSHDTVYHNWKTSGIHTKIVDHYQWISYSQYDPLHNIQFVAVQRYDLRENLLAKITQEHIWPLLWMYPLLMLVLWGIIRTSFHSITLVTHMVQHSPVNAALSPLPLDNVPREIAPLLEAINALLERLRGVFEKETRFHADAAHELKTPLAVIKTQAQVALRAEKLAEKNTILQKLISGVDRANHVVSQLLVLSRYDGEKPLPSATALFLAPVLQTVCEELQPIAHMKQTVLQFAQRYPNEEGDRVRIMGDPIALSILFKNILENAIQYSPAHASVTLSMEQAEPGWCAVNVIDNGPGVPEAEQQRVLERFYRQLGHTTPGSGLGLSIAKRIAKMHQAHFSLQTAPSGQGLWVRLVFVEYDTTWLNEAVPAKDRSIVQ